MGTTIEDIQYDEYIESLEKTYTDALESLANSKSLVDLRRNLGRLQRARGSLPDWMITENDDQYEELEVALSEIATIEKIYKTLIEQKKRGNFYFIAGIIIGSEVTVLSSLIL